MPALVAEDGRDQRRQGFDGAVAQPNPHPRAGLAVQFVGQQLEIGKAADKVIHFLQENPAIGAGIHAPAAADEQLETQFCFQKANLIAQRRLGNAQFLAGLAEAAFAPDGMGIAQLPVVHVPPGRSRSRRL